MIGLAIDPGVKHLGIAVFMGEELVHAALLSGTGGQPHPDLETIPELLTFTSGLVSDAKELDEPVDVVLEIPKVYDARYQKGDQGDLIRLAIVVGCCAQALSSVGVKSILFVEPKDWKGQTPKKVMQGRLQKTLTRRELENVELPEAGSLAHNVWDAVGIGCWRWKRGK